jgi:hypothetical protein
LKVVREVRFAKMRARAGRVSTSMCMSVSVSIEVLVERVARAERPAVVTPER